MMPTSTTTTGFKPVGVYTPKTLGDPNAIRKFTDAGIESAMNAALANLPKKKHLALVLYGDKGAIKGAIYGRKKGRFFGLGPPGEWTFVATAGRTWSGQLDAGVAVGYSI